MSDFGFEIRQHAGGEEKYYISKTNQHGKRNRWYHLKYKTVNLTKEQVQETYSKIIIEYSSQQGKNDNGIGQKVST